MEEKKIVMECRIYDGRWRLVIADQTHRNEHFGNPYDSFISSKGFCLTSCEYPNMYEGEDLLYVWGYDTDCDDDRISVYESTTLRKIIHAVREYNSHLIITDLPVIPKDDTFIIE